MFCYKQHVFCYVHERSFYANTMKACLCIHTLCVSRYVLSLPISTYVLRLPTRPLCGRPPGPSAGAPTGAPVPPHLCPPTGGPPSPQHFSPESLHTLNCIASSHLHCIIALRHDMSHVAWLLESYRGTVLGRLLHCATLPHRRAPNKTPTWRGRDWVPHKAGSML